MSESALQLSTNEGLRVAIVAADAARFAELRELLLDAGHVVEAIDAAQLVLYDGDALTIDKPGVHAPVRGNDSAGTLHSDASAAQIDAALRAVALGLTVRMTSTLDRRFEELHEQPARALLTPRELDVLAAIGAGLTNKAIARQLNISLHTVKFHVESLFRKLDVRTRAEAVAQGLERYRRDVVEL